MAGRRSSETAASALERAPPSSGGYAQFARAKIDRLRRYLPYKDGTPPHDTFGRLFRLIKPEQFEAVFADLARRVAAGSAGQVAADGKSNGITSFPELLKLLDLRGRDVTMDALHTQRASAKLLHEAGAHTTSCPEREPGDAAGRCGDVPWRPARTRPEA